MNAQTIPGTEQPSIPAILGKNPTFIEICIRYHLFLDYIENFTGIDKHVLHEMCEYRPVCKADAEKVLRCVSAISGEDYMLGNTAIPTFEGEGEGKQENGQAKVS